MNDLEVEQQQRDAASVLEKRLLLAAEPPWNADADALRWALRGEWQRRRRRRRGADVDADVLRLRARIGERLRRRNGGAATPFLTEKDADDWNLSGWFFKSELNQS